MIHIIAIEGLDGSGKTYLSEKLVDSIERCIGDKLVVVRQSFPMDRSNILDTCNKLLGSDATFLDNLNIIDLFAQDRLNWWHEINKKYRDENRDILVIADRYILSNPMYNVPAIIRNQYLPKKKAPYSDSYEYIKSHKRDMTAIIDFITRIVLDADRRTRKPEGTIFLNTKHSVRMKRLDERETRDVYELEDMINLEEMCIPQIMELSQTLKYTGNMTEVVTVPNERAIDELSTFIIRTIRLYGADC